MNFNGLTLKTLRGQKGLSAAELALAIGRTGKNPSQGIYDIENGKVKSPKAAEVHKMAKVLEVNPSVFFDSIDEKMQDQLMMLDEPGLEYNRQPYIAIEQKYINALEEIIRLQQEIINLQKRRK